MVPESVLAAFGVTGAAPVPLPGGQGTSWRAGDIVLKPAGSPRKARWTAGLYSTVSDSTVSDSTVSDSTVSDSTVSDSTVSGPGFRVPRPVRAASGDWLAEGWVAWQWVRGAPANWSGVSRRWPELVAASRAFHAALSGVPAPGWVGRDDSPWTVADQVAWGERDPEALLGPAGGSLGEQVRGLLTAIRPVNLPAQLAHGDLAGNVLFADGQSPAVIDFAPYWRPAGLAIAVAAVDALLWSRADPQLLDELAGEPELDQLLARALVYRLVSEIGVRDDDAGFDAVARAGQPVTDLVLARLAGAPRPAAYTSDARLRALVAEATGTTVTELRRAGDAEGHTRALKRLATLAGGRTVFVKASGPGADVSAEVTAYESIAPAPFLPGVIALRRDPLPLLVLEALPASGWVTGWSREAVAGTGQLLADLHARTAPAQLPRWADPGAGDPGPWRAIGRAPARLLRMQVCSRRWLSANLAALSEAAAGAHLAGERLVHGDVRAGNLCYAGGRLVLADWATAAAGNPWYDTHSWLVTLAAEGGPQPEEHQGPGAAGHAALIAGAQVLRAPSRDSDPVLFDLRRRRLEVALEWAARLLRLPPPEFA